MGGSTSERKDFVYFGSKRLHGRKLSRSEFLMLDSHTFAMNADIIAQFLRQLHAEKDIFPIKRRDHCLLHGDFSLDHLLFGPDNIVCGVLDFGDSRIGMHMSDFVYLLDDNDPEEFDATFGNMVLDRYKSAAMGRILLKSMESRTYSSFLTASNKALIRAGLPLISIIFVT